MKYNNYLLFAILLSYSLPLSAQQTLYKSITHDNMQRTYNLYIPASYNAADSVPLLLCFHGYTSSANTIMFYTNFQAIADTAGFIVAYPQGTILPGTGNTHWNVGGWTTASTVDDVGFTAALLDTISADYSINQDRIYSTGMSNGGYMSFLLACQLSHKIAAIASITGSMTPQMYSACNPQHPMPALQMHGTSDGTVPYNGDPTWTKSISDVIQYWTNYNQASSTAAFSAMPNTNTSDGSTVERYAYLNGDSCSQVEHYKVLGGGHDWPGAWGNMDISASKVVWNFVSQYDINGRIQCSPATSIYAQAKPSLDYRIFVRNASLQVSHDFTQVLDFEIYALDGRLLKSGQVNSAVQEIDLGDLSKGLYFFRMGGKTKKFMVFY